MSKLISLVLDKAEAKAEVGEPLKSEAPRYPYGTSLYLDEIAMKKLGITAMPEVGDTLNIMAVGKVTGTSQREYEGGAHQTLDIQLTEMSVEDTDASDEGLESAPARKLYPKG